MAAQLGAVYFQAFQLAYDMAKRAERAFQSERAVSASSYIQFGHWDSLRQGLLAGERLGLDLKRLELAYLEHDRHELELTKHVSLRLHDPMALITLKATGRCEVSLPEQLFDMDYPGHYLRRIKSVSLTLPCVVGEYASINCTLTHQSSRIRVSADAGGDYAIQGADDARFVQGFAAVTSIATSHAQEDSGTFELSFRDERYLPFEGAGADSQWVIELPADTNAFDLDTLSDVVMHVRYTARDGGEALRGAVRQALAGWIAEATTSPLVRMFSLRQEFPTEWTGFLEPTGSHQLPVELALERFPFQFRRRNLRVRKVELFLKLNTGMPAGVSLSLQRLGGAAEELALGDYNGLPWGSKEYAGDGAPLGTWTVSVAGAAPDALAAVLEDIVLVCHYSVA